MKPANIKTNCKWFKGQVPCKPHKQDGRHCEQCAAYVPVSGRILVIKLGAAGDVIRTTPLLRKIRQESPNAEITWVTYFPEFLTVEWVGKILSFELKNILWLEAQKFDWLINLDKDDEALALASRIEADRKSGFGMDEYGKCVPFGAAETHKWLTGLWDDINLANTKNYMEEIFEICGYEFDGEEYILDKPSDKTWDEIDTDKKVFGLNTGCGNRWLTRLWPDDKWIALAGMLKEQENEVVILGGPQEHKKNIKISKESGAKYLGCFDLSTFISLVGQCDIVVTQVTMALHIAIALGKSVALINNIFNRSEFHLYGRGVIVEPDLKCLGCFKERFDEKCPVDNCMELVEPEDIIREIESL